MTYPAPVKKADRTKTAPAPRQLNVIEAVLVALSNVCDGAHSHDKSGFNGTDTRYGKSLAQQIEAGRSLTYKQAQGAIRLLPKYKKQLVSMTLTVPTLEDFFALYKNPKRIEIIGNEIAIFTPYADRMSHADSKSCRFEPSNSSIRYPKTTGTAKKKLESLPADFDLSPEFSALVNVQESQPRNATAACSVPLLVDLLLDEHPERCIVVSGSTDADEHFKCKVSHLDGVFNDSDNTWRFSLATLPLLLVYFPAPDYKHSDTLKGEFEPIECGF